MVALESPLSSDRLHAVVLINGQQDGSESQLEVFVLKLEPLKTPAGVNKKHKQAIKAHP